RLTGAEGRTPAAPVPALGERRDPPERARGRPGQAEALRHHAAAGEGRGTGTPGTAGGDGALGAAPGPRRPFRRPPAEDVIDGRLAGRTSQDEGQPGEDEDGVRA